MKTPEKIKEGLCACCILSIRDEHGNVYTHAKCGLCPYKLESPKCIERLCFEALVYIRQLEAERDALLNETKGFCTSCAFREECHKRENVIGDCLKLPLLHLGDCKHWQWRGVQEVMNEKT